MKYEPSSITKEEQVLGLAIARSIRVSRDERDAVRRVCLLLGLWGIEVSPGELGSERRGP